MSAQLRRTSFLSTVKQYLRASRTFFKKFKGSGDQNDGQKSGGNQGGFRASEETIAKEKQFVAKTEKTLPIAVTGGTGAYLKDCSGNCVLDFSAGNGSVILGHSHPAIVKAMGVQASTLALTGRQIVNCALPNYAECLTTFFGYDKMIPLNTGNEAAEVAVKMARKWGYMVKNIEENEAMIVMPEGGYWGSSIAAISTSNNPPAYDKFGPYLKGFGLVPFDDLCALQEVLKNEKVCAYMMEPILAKNKVWVPSDRYLKEVRRITSANNVLWIVNEVSTGMGRTGAWIACDHECVRPDILILGKGLSAGFYPVSAVLANNDVMCVMEEGSHSSTFGGNPIAAKLVETVMKVIQDENVIVNAAVQGEKLRAELICRLPKDKVPCIRGRGLMNGIKINPQYGTNEELVCKLALKGLFARTSSDNFVLFTPPLNIQECDLVRGLDIITQAVHELKCKPPGEN